MWEAFPIDMRNALDSHDALLSSKIAAMGGAVFKTVGDGFYAVFDGPSNAVAAALSAQLALCDPFRPLALPLRVRMAVHTGEAEERNGDYVGLSVNRASRMLCAARGGQTLVSQLAYELVHEDLPDQVSLEYLGLHRLKDLALPEHIFQLVHPALPLVPLPIKARKLQSKMSNTGGVQCYPICPSRLSNTRVA